MKSEQLKEDLMESLASMLNDEVEDKGFKMPDVKDQILILRGLVEAPIDFKVGDLIKRNVYGKERYSKPEKDNVGIIVDVFKEPNLNDEDQITHGVMGFVHKNKLNKPSVHISPIDFRFYDKVKE